jgi:hypothetical protein
MNMRQQAYPAVLGVLSDGSTVDNRKNFPASDVEVPEASPIYEIPNAFPFHGTTYIGKKWADAIAENPSSIRLPLPASTSFARTVQGWLGKDASRQQIQGYFASLPEPMLLALAACSTDPEDLKMLAELSCEIEFGAAGSPTGLRYRQDDRKGPEPVLLNKALFEAVVNNPALPDLFKEVMVLRPGAQGNSEIVGEWLDESASSHVFEYLRCNSYIPHGHYAANMANDCIRYSAENLTLSDMNGMRRLYCQRTFVRLACELEIDLPPGAKDLDGDALEELRIKILLKLRSLPPESLRFTATLWGWNYGFDYSPSHYRLHASHQQIHQQFALVPQVVPALAKTPGLETSYSCGDLIAEFIRSYRRETGQPFFDTYIKAIRTNSRMDGKTENSSLILYQDSHVLLFVPKAQTSQWELQLLTVKPAGNILEADSQTRQSLDRAMFLAVRILTSLGASMITTIEYPKRFDIQDDDQRLLYRFLPKLPYSMGAFSEAQLRFISGHYPEDFAAACRNVCPDLDDVPQS